MNIPRRPGALALAVMIALGTATAIGVACGDDDDDHSQVAGVVTAINVLDKAGLHDIDTSITADGKVPATAHTTATHLQTVVLVTDWPKDLKDPARKLAAVFGDFASAIDTDTPDMKKAADASNKAHAGEHDFSHQVWEYLGKKAGLKAEDGGHAE